MKDRLPGDPPVRLVSESGNAPYWPDLLVAGVVVGLVVLVGVLA